MLFHFSDLIEIKWEGPEGALVVEKLLKCASLLKTLYYELQPHFWQRGYTWPLFFALFSSNPCFFQTMTLCCMGKKSRTLLISGLSEKKGKSCPCPRPICYHNIRITTSRLWSQDMACISSKVMLDWWKQEMYIIGEGGRRAGGEARIKKKASASKTSILSHRKLDYIHHITRKKPLEDNLYMNQSWLMILLFFTKRKLWTSLIWNVAGKAVSYFLKTILTYFSISVKFQKSTRN